MKENRTIYGKVWSILMAVSPTSFSGRLRHKHDMEKARGFPSSSQRYSAAETVGKPILLLLPPERIDEESDILARIQRGRALTISKLYG
jgi:hypothetical protein